MRRIRLSDKVGVAGRAKAKTSLITAVHVYTTLDYHVVLYAYVWYMIATTSELPSECPVA